MIDGLLYVVQVALPLPFVNGRRGGHILRVGHARIQEATFVHPPPITAFAWLGLRANGHYEITVSAAFRLMPAVGAQKTWKTCRVLARSRLSQMMQITYMTFSRRRLASGCWRLGTLANMFPFLVKLGGHFKGEMVMVKARSPE